MMIIIPRGDVSSGSISFTLRHADLSYAEVSRVMEPDDCAETGDAAPMQDSIIVAAQIKSPELDFPRRPAFIIA